MRYGIMKKEDYHFEHGDSFTCVVCLLEQVSAKDIKGAQASILEENKLSLVQGGLELKLLMDKRELEEPELLLLLCAAAFARTSIADTVHAYYYLLCTELLDVSKFKRFRLKNTNKALRRRLAQLKKTYNLDSKLMNTLMLQVVSKHPAQKLVLRAKAVLNVVRNMVEESVGTLPKVDQIVADPEPFELSVLPGKKRTNKHLRIVFRRNYGEVSDEKRRSTALALLSLASNLDDFYAHFLQQYDNSPVELEELYLYAFGDIIPKLASKELLSSEKQGVMNKLRSLLFISLREKRRFEAFNIVKVLLQHTAKNTNDYWRLVVFERYLSDEVDVRSFANDLYQKFMDQLTFEDKQLYLSLKFDVLVKYSRFSKALELSNSFSIPKLHLSVGVWMKVLECRLAILLIHTQEAAIVKLLLEEVLKIDQNIYEELVKETRVSSLLKQLVSLVEQRYPVYTCLLTPISALLLVIVSAFEDIQTAETTRLLLHKKRISIPKVVLAQKLKTYMLLAFEAGNYPLAWRLGVAVGDLDRKSHCDWEVMSCLGQLEASESNLVKAKRYHVGVLPVVERAKGRNNSYAFCLLCYGHELFLENRLLAAETLFTEAFAIFESNRNYANCALCLFLKVMLLWKSESWEASLLLLGESERLLKEYAGKDKRHQIAAVYTALAHTNHRCGNPQAADHYKEKAIQYLEKESYGADCSTIQALKKCGSWAKWEEALAAKYGDSFLDLVPYLFYPGPSVGIEELAIAADSNSFVRKGFALFPDDDD